MNELTNLTTLQSSYNNFSGQLPQQICGAGSLENFIITGYHFTGLVPKSLKNYSSLFRVRFDGNKLIGNLTEAFSIYPHLNYIDLSGSISPALGEATRLQRLDLSSNNLSRKIPEELGNLKLLLKLILSDNQLYNEIPSRIGMLADLQKLNLAINNLNGSIPKALGGCFNLLELNLGKNKLEGNDPFEIASMYALENFDLSSNLLIEEIPPSFGQMKCLETLNLYHNSLSCSIPAFDEMLSLVSIDMSYNQLEGPIPNSKALREAPFEAFRNNKGLCGNATGLKPCPKITQNLQEGGYGSVYKAELISCQVVAVKKLHTNVDGGMSNLKAFTSEIRALTEIRHCNIVKLYGLYSHPRHSFLVYVFLEGGSV
nr:MDIS1-interacting receptor like kinase 2-like [Ziziphus jujuba var. spinosa]